MAGENLKHHYRSTESKFKGGAKEMYVTYDVEQKTRGKSHATYHKVKRVYIAGDVQGWHAGQARMRTGRQVNGVTIEYQQTRRGYHRKPYSGHRNSTAYQVKATTIKSTTQKYHKVVEVPEDARNVHFYRDESRLPEKYHTALQNVR